ncbi:ABC transporter permease [Pontixanthobacter gangjinensis]|uniref:ABC transporter permease n=1 Tax=Christiangramia aestuarii TaxID=1028746 RepID=A0A7K1LRR9_9FLAO|nr:FtsX-like permease family protein [Christiangramia aestuarii]MUP43505.1 ABC transporter permease [Christiangramia aestuarii]
MTNWNLILSIARTHLLSKFRQTAIAALGVTFGIGSYISLVGFMTGLNQMLDSLILNQTPHVHIYNEIQASEDQPADLFSEFENSLKMIHSIKPRQTQKKIHNALPIIDLIEKEEPVLAAIPQVKTQIFYISGSIELGGNLTGIDAMQEVRYFNFGDYLIEGEPQSLENVDNAIFLGAGVAKKLAISIGDRLQISTVKGGSFPLKVAGIFQSGIADLDNIQSFASIKTVQRILGEPENYITDINVKLKDIDYAPILANKIQEQFRLEAVDINTANAQFETGSTIRNLITYAVSITLLIVAGFGIYNILNMLIYEKMNDIAILKATGFSGKDVQMIFMSQAMLIGFIGGLLGLLIGYILSRVIDNIPFQTEALPTIKTYPINYDPWFYLIGIGFALISTFLAGYLPSHRAKKIDPVDIIRRQ